MQQIIISGIVTSAPEPVTRTDGTKYIIFYVACLNSSNQREKYSHYRCAYRVIDIREGDQVFIVGSLRTGIRKDKNGEVYVDLFVIVEHLTIGKRA